MTAVVDASVAAKWFFLEPGSQSARDLLTSPALLIAPDLLFAEVGNLAWKKFRAGAARAEQLRELSVVLPGAFAEVVGSAELLPRALAIAQALDHPVYDSIYLALAEQRSAGLVTADQRLLARVASSPWSSLVTALG